MKQPLMEDNLSWRTTFDGGLLLMEDTFDGSLIEDEFNVAVLGAV